MDSAPPCPVRRIPIVLCRIPTEPNTPNRPGQSVRVFEVAITKRPHATADRRDILGEYQIERYIQVRFCTGRAAGASARNHEPTE